MSFESPVATKHGEVVVTGGASGYSVQVVAGNHQLAGDEPASAGGEDSGPSPYDFLLAGLGSCTSMTLRMYADRKGWPLEGVQVRLRHSKIHAEDCSVCETKVGKIDLIEKEVRLAGPLSDEQRARLMEIADRCPVHRTLTSETRIRSSLASA